MPGLPVVTLPPACPFSNIREIHLLDCYKLLTGRAVSSCIIANSLIDSEEVHMGDKSANRTDDYADEFYIRVTGKTETAPLPTVVILLRQLVSFDRSRSP
jgi:hypothetical protein